MKLYSAHGQGYPVAPLPAARAPGVCLPRQLSSLTDSIQDLMFHLEYCEEDFLSADSDSQEGTIPLGEKNGGAHDYDSLS